MKKNIFFISLVLCFCLAQRSMAQTKRCGATEMQQQYWAQHPERTAARNALELGRKQLDKASSEGFASDKGRFAQAVLTIPVVFHVIHSGEAVGAGRNIATAKILQQLQILNQDFSKTNSDANQIPSQFQGIAANTEIQFCLAAINPAGQATDGIDRIQYNSVPNSAYIEQTIKPATTWNARRYLNIWVLEMPQAAGSTSFVLGYAYLPESGMVGSNVDGFVVDYRYVGASPANRVLGRTATHEIGHYLGLAHPWGSNEGDCQGDSGAEDDGIADTPFSSDPNYTPPTGVCNMTPTQCGHIIFGSNYMDYSDDPCMNAFSTGQKNIMRAVVSGTAAALGLESRAELVNNAATTCNQIPSGSCANPYSAAFNMGFEPTQNLAGWTAENVNADSDANGAVTWKFSDSTHIDGEYGPHSGTQYARYFYNTNGISGANDWLYSPCLTLQANKTYSLKFWYAVGRTGGMTYPEKLKVMVGTAANSAGMTTLISDLGTLTNAYPNYQQGSYDFSVTQNADYYLGFKCYSSPDQYMLMLDDINLTGRLTATDDYRSLATAVKIYPNPTSDEFQVRLTTELDTHDAYLSLCDVAGREVQRQNWAQGFESTFISTTSLQEGLYFVTVHLGKEHFTQKIVILR